MHLESANNLHCFGRNHLIKSIDEIIVVARSSMGNRKLIYTIHHIIRFRIACPFHCSYTQIHTTPKINPHQILLSDVFYITFSIVSLVFDDASHPCSVYGIPLLRSHSSRKHNSVITPDYIDIKQTKQYETNGKSCLLTYYNRVML